jgi:phospholipid/cholesterol/gamma-HCH transport system substrate-binding protein
MRLQYKTSEKVTGIFILLTLLIFLFIVATVGRGKNWFRKHITYYTTFQEGYNLTPGSRVKLFGTDIGKVTDVVLTADNQVRVKIRVLATYGSRLRADSTAIVESPTFIGSEYIAISPGSANAPGIPPESVIPSKEKKKLTEYLDEYDVEDKLKRFGEIIEDLARITAQLKDSDGPLLGTLGNIHRLSVSIDAGEGTLGRILRTDDLYYLIKNELETVAEILASIKDTADRSVKITEKAGAIAENLEQTMSTAPEIITKVDELLDKMLQVAALLTEAMIEVPEISREAKEGMREVNNLLDAVKKNFLVRPYLPPPAEPESHGVEIRGGLD